MKLDPGVENSIVAPISSSESNNWASHAYEIPYVFGSDFYFCL